mmetsp:Transcript_17169/g.41318  ORF Transcript_17169/g.41318 Transcript_17169/m.41318 type:complete len:208 (+) Transcript_17169:515-1138(+)
MPAGTPPRDTGPEDAQEPSNTSHPCLESLLQQSPVVLRPDQLRPQHPGHHRADQDEEDEQRLPPVLAALLQALARRELAPGQGSHSDGEGGCGAEAVPGDEPHRDLGKPDCQADHDGGPGRVLQRVVRVLQGEGTAVALQILLVGDNDLQNNCRCHQAHSHHHRNTTVPHILVRLRFDHCWQAQVHALPALPRDRREEVSDAHTQRR